MTTIFIGIDPGMEGGLCAITPSGVVAAKMPPTERDKWDWFSRYKPQALIGANQKSYAVIEHQDPRPTMWLDKETKKWRQSILKSTCLLYGNYMSLRAMITAAQITLLEDCPAKRWQAAMDISPRKKGETPYKWKARLKQRAQQLHPELDVTLATADSILLAQYCKKISSSSKLGID